MLSISEVQRDQILSLYHLKYLTSEDLSCGHVNLE
jgi:hypothetical protein